jgi:CIC family chloride channel protein
MSGLAHWFRRVLAPSRSQSSAAGVTLLLACVVGVCAALLSLGVRSLVDRLDEAAFLRLGQQGGSPNTWYYALLAVPIVGFLLCAYVVHRWAPEAAGSGIDRVMGAVGHRAGHIRTRVIPLKSVLTVLSIGAGAPLGMEGPVVYAGGAVGSLIGRRAGRSVPNIRALVAAGAAAGLAAQYGTPFGAAIFSAELILGSASVEALLPVIIASFLAVATRHFIRGPGAEYVLNVSYTLSFGDYVVLALLGILCGLAAACFIKLVFAYQGAADRLHAAWWGRALFGGALIAAAGLLLPELLGTGKPAIQRLLDGAPYPLAMLAAFLVLKPLLCSVAFGSGTSGGVFAPSLFVGGALGALFTRGLAPLHLTAAPSGVMVMVGMAAIMGAVMGGPLQAILIAFELTHDYSLAPALMLACVVSLKVAQAVEPESVFTRRLVREGERLSGGMDFGLLEGLTVRDVMRADYVALPAGAEIGSIASLLRRSEDTTFPVTDAEGRLAGIVTLSRLVSAAAGRSPRGVLVQDLLEPHAICLAPDESLISAWQTLGHYDYDCLPVCPPGEDRIIGICERSAIGDLHDRQAFAAMVRESRPGQAGSSAPP